MEKLVDTAFYCSLLTEEGRPLSFQIAVYSPAQHERAKAVAVLFTAGEAITLHSKIPLTVESLRRLAPAADATRFVICVDCGSDGELYIWALLDTGDPWWHDSLSDNEAAPAPEAFTIRSMAPGELSVVDRFGTLVTLKGGKILKSTSNALWSGPLADFFRPAERTLYADAIRLLETDEYDSDDNDYPETVYRRTFTKLLKLMQYAGHGGTILVVRDEIQADDTRLLDRVKIIDHCAAK